MDQPAPLKIENVVVAGEPAEIHCEGGAIRSITRPGEGREAAQAVEVLDGRGCVASPPLINAHTHAAMTLFRGSGDDLPLMEWLRTRVWPYEERLSADDVYAGTRLAIVEMVRSGTLFFNDMYWHYDAAARAVEELGVRACLSRVLIDFGDPSRSGELRREIERGQADARGRSPLISYAVGPHSIYTVSEDSLRWAGAFADEHDLPLHIHLAETRTEVEDCRADHGCTPVQYLERLGLLSERTVAAHTVWLSDEDVALLGERRVVCVNSPVSNMKLAVGGAFPYRRLAQAGAVCAIGTDGPGSNNNLDLLEEMKIAALLQKFVDDDATALPAEDVWAMATEWPAACFGLPGPELEPGRPADLILIDPHRPEMEPPHSLVSNLVYSAHGTVVDSAICAGRVVMRHRAIDGEDEIVAAARASAQRLFAGG